MQLRLLILFFCIGLLGYSQETNNNRVQKKLAVEDSIVLDSVSINPFKFKVLNKQLQLIDSSYYSVDFGKSVLRLNKTIATDSIYVEYTKYPEFLTKEYFLFDEKIIVQDISNTKKLYQLGTSNTQRNFVPFSGLETSGSISRGISVGNNQNSVLNSELDLQVSGKISDNVSLRASLQDANIPLQEGGYSQRLDEFDQVFVELFSDNWLLRAGDVNLENNTSYFSRFTKKVQGVYGTGTIKRDSSATNFFASGAIVRGQYTKSTLKGQEGNQGPYKLAGPNGELFVLLVSGSETVYVNGLRLERGENNDYIIDYNAGEIIFNATYPITSEMRITVEYQYSDRNYSRIIAYGGGSHENKKLSIYAHVYTENDAKNQPLQQNLSTEQVSILADAGDDSSLMTAPSESLEAYSENKILYKKELIGGIEAFIFSTNPDDELYQVKFSLVGDGNGNYIIDDDYNNTLGTIYEYVGNSQGNYEPVIQLVAPTKLQMAVVDASYKPNDKTEFEFELAGSKNDLNLFSNIDDENNNGFAGKLTLKRALIKKDSSWNLNAFIDTDYIDKNFKTIERLYRVEFDRDWNLETPLGHQNIIRSGVNLHHHKKGFTNYTFEHLNYSENYNGNRHVLTNDLKFNKLRFSSHSSYLTSSSPNFNSTFLRLSAQGIYDLKKGWIGAKTSSENNQQKDNTTQLLTGASQKYSSYEAFTGIGDSTNIYVAVGYKYRVNDSLRNGALEKVNSSNTYYLKSRIINTNTSKLSVHANYRILNYTDETLEDEKSVNSRVLYQQHLWKQFLRFNTTFEMNAGVVPQQDFTYVAVDEGQGFYTWIDYNTNGIQELNEFEIAQFQDQATFIKVLLPNQVFVKTQQNKWSTSLAIDPKDWINTNSSFKKIAANFFNQTSFLIDKKTKRDNTIGFNLFETDEEQFITVNSSFKNSLFFRRGKQRYSTTYSYLQNKSRNILSIGFQENKSNGHQLQFAHKFLSNWLFDLKNNYNKTKNTSENFANNNYKINEYSFFPKLSYLASSNTKFDAFYQFTNKENQVSAFEKLNQQRMGVSFSIAKQDKISLNGEFNYYLNNFDGSSFSPVAYQMLEGLEKGKNLTWSLFAQKRITKFLDLNISYFGRKTETSQVIHSGNVQLKAFF